MHGAGRCSAASGAGCELHRLHRSERRLSRFVHARACAPRGRGSGARPGVGKTASVFAYGSQRGLDCLLAKTRDRVYRRDRYPPSSESPGLPIFPGAPTRRPVTNQSPVVKNLYSSTPLRQFDRRLRSCSASSQDLLRSHLDDGPQSFGLRPSNVQAQRSEVRESIPRQLLFQNSGLAVTRAEKTMGKLVGEDAADGPSHDTGRQAVPFPQAPSRARCRLFHRVP